VLDLPSIFAAHFANDTADFCERFLKYREICPKSTDSADF